ncbi:MAG: ORF6N domain-containing protein [Candidatus Paceibacterota bacterium]
MTDEEGLTLVENIERSILFMRGKKVMLDVDLANLYGVTTKRLNEQVKRNIERFPDDFMFQLTETEKNEVVAKCDHLCDQLKYSPYLPYAFTEHGALMLANVIKSATAIQASIQIVRIFMELRRLLETREELSRKMRDMETKYDGQFAIVFEYIRELMTPPETPRPPIGFKH